MNRARTTAANESEASSMSEDAPRPRRMLSQLSGPRRQSGGCSSCAIGGGEGNEALTGFLVIAAMTIAGYDRRRRRRRQTVVSSST
jgi:hypothetical protein